MRLLALFLFAVAALAKGRDFYKILGIKKSATKTEIKKAFRKLSTQYHPDRNKEKGATEKFQDISAAYEVLSDDEKRRIYDSHGEEGVNQAGQGGGGGHPFDFMNDFFGGFGGFGFGGGGGGRGGQRRQEVQKLAPLKLKLHPTLEQLLFGETLHLSYRRDVLCVNADDCLIEKRDCQGLGVRMVTQQMAPGFVVQNQMKDESCIGPGKAWKPNCSACPQGQTEEEAIRLNAVIEPGMKDSDTIVFDGVGDQRVGYEAGDLVYIIQAASHPTFTRIGDDLHTTLEISLVDALNGFEMSFLGLDKLPVEVKRVAVTDNNEVIRINGRGMYRSQHSKARGDLVIKVKVNFPRSGTILTNEQKKSINDSLRPTGYSPPNIRI